MSMTELKLSFPTEKLEALRFFMGKKELTVEQEMQSYLDKTYEKAVPVQVREYVESRMEQTPAQQEERTDFPERSQSVRPTRRQRQREETDTQRSVASSDSAALENAPEQEVQGMTMGM